MAINGRKIAYLEHLLGSGLPLHRPLRTWSDFELARLEDPATLSLLSDDDLARLIEMADGDEGIDVATLPAAPIPTTADIETSQRGRPPLALACRCGLCERYRQSGCHHIGLRSTSVGDGGSDQGLSFTVIGTR